MLSKDFHTAAVLNPFWTLMSPPHAPQCIPAPFQTLSISHSANVVQRHMLYVHTGHDKDSNQPENVQYYPLSGTTSQQALIKLQKLNSELTRRHTYNGTGTAATDLFETSPHIPPFIPSC